MNKGVVPLNIRGMTCLLCLFSSPWKWGPQHLKIPHSPQCDAKSPPLPYNPQYTGMEFHIHVSNSVMLPLFNILGTKTRNKFVPWNKVEARLEKKFESSNSQSSVLTMNNNSYSIVRKQYIKPWWCDIFQWGGKRISSGPETSIW